jgi:hypothetical protein
MYRARIDLHQISYFCNMNNYTAFGLQIASEPELPGLLPGNGSAEVTIRFGRVPEHLPEPHKGKGVAYEINDDSFLLNVPGVAKYLVNHGNEIVIDKQNGADDHDIALFTINTPIGALLYQRGYLPLHASAIAVNGGCAIFTGISGAGKSTLFASFHQHGFHVLSDEVCAISLSPNGEPYVQPGVAYTYLWRDVLDFMGKDVNKLRHRNNNPEKYKLHIEERFCQEALPLKRVYVLATKNTPGIEIEEIKGTDKFLPVKQNAYRPRIGKEISNPAAAFMMHVGIGKHTVVKRVSRPRDIINIDQLRELIIKDMDYL